MKQAIVNIFFGSLLFFTTCESYQFRHGDVLNIVSVKDKSYLTAYEHDFRPLVGFFPGKVFAESELHDSPNQVWDLIRWPQTPENSFWLYPKAATLNEITTAPGTNEAIPPNNPVELQYNPDGSEFIIRSTILDKCVESKGPQEQILYAPCNATNPAQQWKGLQYSGDKARNKIKFGCKFYG